jgi:signal transduction histidine kinase
VLEIVVLALSLMRLALTVAFNLAPDQLVLEVSTVTIFVVPVVVASLEFGLSGALFTVAWVFVLCIPRLTEAAARHETSALWVEVLQLALLAVIAVLIGQRVSAASVSREATDAAREARLRAERLYQEMFESNQSPILIVDSDGYVIDSNASADRAFVTGTGLTGRTSVDGGPLPFPRLVDVIGPEAAALVLTRLVSDVDGSNGPPGNSDGAVGDGDERVPPVAFEIDGQPVLYRPTATLVGRPGSDRRMQVIFEDVTAETRRHDLMEAYAGHVVLGQEEERRHIAQELHDGPLQTLIHLCRQIDSLDTGPGQTAEAAPSLASMRTTVEETIAELRSIARGLRPSVLDDLGLVASINQVLTEASGRQGFDGRFEVIGTVRRLPSSAELALFRIAQEAITNVERHASAHQVSVLLEFADGGIRLRVEDDGEGFDRDRQRREDEGQSQGLPGMGERARLIGGRLRITSQVGAGTTVEASIPTSALGTR